MTRTGIYGLALFGPETQFENGRINRTVRRSPTKDVELNVPAWTALMGARAALPAMSISWAFDSCPEPEDGRKKIYIHEDTNDKKEFNMHVLFSYPL